MIGLPRDVWVAAWIIMSVAAAGATIILSGPGNDASHTPGWQPPDGLFRPAYAALFTLTAMAGVLASRSAMAG
jgi:tryptophan-rich sensory protein